MSKWRFSVVEKAGKYRIAEKERGPLKAANRFLRGLEVRGLSPRTIRAYAYDLLALYRWLDESGKAIEQLRQAELMGFVHKQRESGAHPNSINRRLLVSRLLYRFLTGKEMSPGREGCFPAPYYRGRGMTPDGLRRLFRYRRQSPELKRANAHRFRHTFGTDMARAGVRLPVLKELMGHAEHETTLRYINLSMADIADEYHRALAEIQKRYPRK
jgi:site-specific recombinase XerD